MINVYGVLRHTFDNEPLAGAAVVLTPMRVRSDSGDVFGTPVFARTDADGVLIPQSRTRKDLAFGTTPLDVPIAEFTDGTLRIGVVINHDSFAEPWLGELIAEPGARVNIASASPLMTEDDREDIGTFKELLELARSYSEDSADWAQAASVSASSAEDSRDDARAFRDASERAASAAAGSRVAADAARADAQAAATAAGNEAGAAQSSAADAAQSAGAAHFAAADATDAAANANAHMQNAAISAGIADTRATAAASSASLAGASADAASASASAADASAGEAANAVAQVQAAVEDAVSALPDATTSTRGLSRFATNAQTSAGTSTTLAVSPSGLRSVLDARLADYEPRRSFAIIRGLVGGDMTGQTSYPALRMDSRIAGDIALTSNGYKLSVPAGLVEFEITNRMGNAGGTMTLRMVRGAGATGTGGTEVPGGAFSKRGKTGADSSTFYFAEVITSPAEYSLQLWSDNGAQIQSSFFCLKVTSTPQP